MSVRAESRLVATPSAVTCEAKKGCSAGTLNSPLALHSVDRRLLLSYLSSICDDIRTSD